MLSLTLLVPVLNESALLDEFMVKTTHDLSDGGLFMSLLESSMVNGLGFEITCDKSVRCDAFLFGEAQSRVLVSVSASKVSDLEAELKKQGVSFTKLGTVKGKDLVIDGTNYGAVNDFKKSFDTSIENVLA